MFAKKYNSTNFENPLQEAKFQSTQITILENNICYLISLFLKLDNKGT